MAYRISSTDALLQQSWENDLWEEIQEQDIITNLVGVYSETKKTLPDEAVMRVMMPAGANTHTIGLVLDLTGAGREGAGLTLNGYTESFNTRKYVIYANDVRHGVDTEKYGRYAQLNSPYRLLENTGPALAKWLKARRGKHAREGALELFSSNLTQSPCSQTQGWNMHWLVKNVAHTSQPSYNSTLATFNANIQTALAAAGTGANARADIQFFTDLIFYINTQWKFRKIGDESVICLVPSRQAMFLKRFNTGRNAAGDYDSMASHQASSLDKKIIDAAWGQHLMKFGPLHLIEDPRNPIVVRDTSDGSITAYYRDVGSTDDRSSYSTSGTTTVFDIMTVIAKSGITESVAMVPRIDDENTDFNRLQSVSISTTYGYQATEFDADTASSTTRIGQGLAVCAFESGSATA